MYILHYAPDNASQIIRLVLEEMGLPYRTALVDRARRAQDSAAYRALNPTGLIPALQTPTATLFETAAILLWLCETHHCMAPAASSPERADFLKWLLFTANTLHADARLLFYPEQYAGSDADLPAFRAATEARILRHLGLVNDLAATRPGFLCVDAPSVLGYYLCCLIRWIALYPSDRFGWIKLSSYPALHVLAESLQSRPAALTVARAEGLGQTIFTDPHYACPPEGSAL
jgi:glutathione S-transferase